MDMAAHRKKTAEFNDGWKVKQSTVCPADSVRDAAPGHQGRTVVELALFHESLTHPEARPATESTPEDG